MPAQTRFDLATASLRLLAYSTLIITDSNASPIPRIGARGLGTTSPNEDLMTTKVGSPVAALTKSSLTNPVAILEHLGMAVCRCGCDHRLFRLRVEVGSNLVSNVHGHQY